jgi:hypothetical protein
VKTVSRQLRLDWCLSSLHPVRRRSTKRWQAGSSLPYLRRLHFVPLEDRRLLTITAERLELGSILVEFGRRSEADVEQLKADRKLESDHERIFSI